MEVSLVFAIETTEKSLADFIELMWDEENAPVDSDEVDSTLHGAFNALEFAEYPSNVSRETETRLLGFEDVLEYDDVDDYVKPCLKAGARRIAVCVYMDEGEKWFAYDQEEGALDFSLGKLLSTFSEEDGAFERISKFAELLSEQYPIA